MPECCQSVRRYRCSVLPECSSSSTTIILIFIYYLPSCRDSFCRALGNNRKWYETGMKRSMKRVQMRSCTAKRTYVHSRPAKQLKFSLQAGNSCYPAPALYIGMKRRYETMGMKRWYETRYETIGMKRGMKRWV